MPKGRLTTVATVAIRRLNPIAIHSPGERENMG
jgi:hypothetical protein